MRQEHHAPDVNHFAAAAGDDAGRRNVRPAGGETPRLLPTTNFVRETAHQVAIESFSYGFCKIR